ncbi:Zinc-type alcohol dehydrogenase-like protein [Cyphellophora attinorum]|uniref:Zinc-type alcohol dehydrogenase-like protein n=1 Tax=Cyphellophora attinorum TaxID=1664694 RepID=A0A0N1HIU5_9EURO|nr:Zinc-type alcohol dehydrogenase-like protein [Phialophora attinorum]KPI36127.1 Zinc-type alcohol dehydrogenase-like protein [Phialophora attinorum]
MADQLRRHRQPQVTTFTVATPSPTQILVKILAVALNYKDGEIIQAPMKHHKTATFPSNLVIGSDAVGQVISVGSSVTQFKPNDRVLSLCFPLHQTGPAKAAYLADSPGMTDQGVLTEYKLFEDWAVVGVPDYLTDEEAATFPIAGTTAWMSLNYFNPIGVPNIGLQGKTLLVQGTGGVSIMGLQLGKASGMKVIVTSSSDSKLERATALGADYTINYRTHPDWDQKVLELTDGKGADLIFENGGAYTTSQSMDCIAFGGTIASIGYLSGKTDPPDANRTNINVRALARNFVLVGILNGPKDRLQELLRFVEQHQVRPVVDKVFSFEEGQEAVRYLWEGGSSFGKVVVRVASASS